MVAQSSAHAQDQFANFPAFIKTSLGCGNLVPAPSHTTSGETSFHALRTVAERAGSFGICLAKSLLNLANKWFHCRDRDLPKGCLMLEHWNPMKKEIEDWLDHKLHKFVVQENKNPQILEERWLDCYLYM